jgi:hypothetical protein
MSGIDREITPDPRPSLVDRHLPNTPQVQRLLHREGKAYMFNDRKTLERVTQAIVESGERTGIDDEEDDCERYGLYFPEAIGYIIRIDGSQTPLYYGEIKIVKTTGEYHAIPRNNSHRDGTCRIFNPASDYKLIVAHPNYQSAQDWLLEDEYEQVKGKLLAEEVI